MTKLIPFKRKKSRPRWPFVAAAAAGLLALGGALIARRKGGQAKYAAGKAKGAAHAVADTVTPSTGEPPDDTTLKDKVQSIVFRETGVPKDAVNVDAHDGTVVLRGEVPSSEQIDQLVGATEKVDGVERVENLLKPAAA